MKITAFFLMLVSLAAPVAGLAIDSTNGSGGAPSRTDYVSFRIIAERNIFDPNRSGRSGRSYTREPERRAPVNRFALLGTMSYEKGRFAFFDGSDSAYRKVLKPMDSIAGFRIVEVAPTCVKLETTNGQVLELCVGMQMKKREEEDWELAGRAESAEGTSMTPSEARSNGGGTAESSDVLTRLMQRREQESGAPATDQPAVSGAKEVETKPAPALEGESNEALKRLLQKREQELNK